MKRLRSLLAAAVAAMLITGATAVGTAPAADAAQAMEPGCAKLRGSGSWWADIYNSCGYTISASVEVDGWDPSCIQIAPYSTGRIGLDPGDEPYYAYEC
ncbi:hypothetical protein [Streptomyces sp. NPDC018693]|uniref:hypothetical protein n=1 Tax=unclassified Streptomyces TaxID=2593676 RepID=UPI0037BCFCCA